MPAVTLFCHANGALIGCNGRTETLTVSKLISRCSVLAPVVLLILSMTSAAAAGGDATRVETLRRYSTLNSIGIEWDIQGDADHDATCRVEYRRSGRSQWSKAMDLLRIDYHGYYGTTKADRRYNMLAGSVLFLRPGTTYEVRLTVADPDGGNTVRQIEVKTWEDLVVPGNGRRRHVVPGDGGGTGTGDDPFRGLAAADADAKPGDVFLMHKGDYGRFSPKTSGQPGRRVHWIPAGDGRVDLHHLNIHANHLWLEGFQITRIAEAARNGVRDRINATDIVLRRNLIQGFHYGVLLGRYKATRWVVSDNVIIGDKDRRTGKGYGREHSSGEGVELNHSSHHVVCYNTISRTADGVSYPGRNCDIFGNDIFEVSDDGLEPDSGYGNVRMWGNRIQETHKAGISFQPMLGSPWYIIRNQIISDTTMFKLRVCDRFVMINNSFIVGKGGVGAAYLLLNCVSRNNIWYNLTHSDYLWIAHVADPKQVASIRRYTNYPLSETGFLPSWATDLDYDAFGKQKPPPNVFIGDVFGWYDTRTKRQTHFGQVKKFAEFLPGVEPHGIDIEAESTFENWSLPANLWRSQPGGKVIDIPPQLITLKADATAIDAGVVLPNIHDNGFTGKAPDLGVHERGLPIPHYGARDDKALKAHADDWVLKAER